ncbi:hypothetical protein AAFF_G00234450 [Aldrovandia affinis]|uniref:Uncharacterized protein n=1 Tax=Aldrovandia affinis TaxID=143900 RepID=A0AAD7SUW1_9TELE|nr:hypothetical protein AAFF_G00234450 [Aldrovandia affinis]
MKGVTGRKEMKVLYSSNRDLSSGRPVERSCICLFHQRHTEEKPGRSQAGVGPAVWRFCPGRVVLERTDPTVGVTMRQHTAPLGTRPERESQLR